MARRRSIDPDIWTDDKFVALSSPAAQLFYIGTISLADDFGRLEWSARQLFARLFAAREDVTRDDVARWMEDVESVKLVTTYTAGGRQLAFHAKWNTHQYVSRPSKSKIPAPLSLVDARTPDEQCPNISTPTDARPQNINTPEAEHSPADTSREANQSLPSVSVSVSVSESVSGASAARAGSRSEPSLGIRFGMDVLGDAVKLGCLGEHLAADPFAWAYKQLEHSELLLETYGEPECRARAHRMLDACVNKRLRRAPSIKALRECWDWSELKPAGEAPRSGRPEPQYARLGAPGDDD